MSLGSEVRKNLFRILDPGEGSKSYRIPDPDSQHCFILDIVILETVLNLLWNYSC